MDKQTGRDCPDFCGEKSAVCASSAADAASEETAAIRSAAASEGIDISRNCKSDSGKAFHTQRETRHVSRSDRYGLAGSARKLFHFACRHDRYHDGFLNGKLCGGGGRPYQSAQIHRAHAFLCNQRCCFRTRCPPEGGKQQEIRKRNACDRSPALFLSCGQSRFSGLRGATKIRTSRQVPISGSSWEEPSSA